MEEKTYYEKKYDLYDSVVTAVYKNILVEQYRCNGTIVIWDFNQESGGDRLYFNVAAIVADVNKTHLYLNLPLWEYIKFKFKRRKRRRNLRWVSPLKAKKIVDEQKTSAFIIMNFIAQSLNIQYSLFDKINNEYYGWTE